MNGIVRRIGNNIDTIRPKFLSVLCTRQELQCQRTRLYSGKKINFTVQGIVPPVFTPFNEDLTINYNVIPEYVQWLNKNGVKSILVGGTTGEHMSLSVLDRKKCADVWLTACRTVGMKMLMQVGGAPLADVLDLAKYSESIGVDGILTLPELYFRPQNVEELVAYVDYVARAAPNTPLLYYHIPKNTNVSINMPVFMPKASKKIPSLSGIKFTSADIAECAEVLKNLRDDQELFIGNVSLLAPGGMVGVTSSIGTFFNLFPHLGHQILDAIKNKDMTTARTLQENLNAVINAHTVEGAWIPVSKAGMEIVSGLKLGPPLVPLKPISLDAKKRIEERLRKMKLI